VAELDVLAEPLRHLRKAERAAFGGAEDHPLICPFGQITLPEGPIVLPSFWRDDS